MSTDFKERRRYLRFDSRIPIRYKKIATADRRELKGSITRNISEGGLMMRIYEFLPLDLRLAMEMPLITGVKSVQGTCRVAWVTKAPFGDQYDVGIEFVNLNQGDTIQIANFVFNRSMEKRK